VRLGIPLANSSALEAALVVSFNSAAMIGEVTTVSFVSEICRFKDDYQSGTELPHFKICRHFI
jgi:hypothetical protein